MMMTLQELQVPLLQRLNNKKEAESWLKTSASFCFHNESKVLLFFSGIV